MKTIEKLLSILFPVKVFKINAGETWSKNTVVNLLDPYSTDVQSTAKLLNERDLMIRKFDKIRLEYTLALYQLDREEPEYQQ